MSIVWSDEAPAPFAALHLHVLTGRQVDSHVCCLTSRVPTNTINPRWQRTVDAGRLRSANRSPSKEQRRYLSDGEALAGRKQRVVATKRGTNHRRLCHQTSTSKRKRSCVSFGLSASSVRGEEFALVGASSPSFCPPLARGFWSSG